MRHTTTATMHFFTSEKDTSILRCFDHRASKSWLKVCVEHIAKARSIHIPRRGVAVRVLFLEVLVSPSSHAFDIKKPSVRSLERSQESSPWKSLDTIGVPVFACSAYVQHVTVLQTKRNLSLSWGFVCFYFFGTTHYAHVGYDFLRFPTWKLVSLEIPTSFQRGAPPLDSMNTCSLGRDRGGVSGQPEVCQMWCQMWLAES